MIAALLLCGCGNEEKLQSRLDVRRQEIAESEYVSFRADVIVELTESVFECVLNVERTEQETVVELAQPEIVAGIRARVSGEGAAIEYEDLVLAIGDEILGEISPVSAALQILQAMGDGFVDIVWQERQGQTELIAAQCYVSENEYIKIWFEAENLIPVYAELVSGGRLVVKCSIEEFALEK